MRRLTLLFAIGSLAAIATMPACTCANSGVGDGGMRQEGDGPVLIGSISVFPPDVTLDLFTGQPPPQQAFQVIYHDVNSDTDVTAQSSFALADTSLGTMSGSLFIAGTAHGGTTQLVASYTPMGQGLQTAQATIHVRVHGTFQGPDCMAGACPTFPGDTAPACAAGAAATIVYPNDGALLPPNLNTLDVQFMPGSGDTLFEVDFENSATDVRIVTKCATKVKDTRNVDTGGCELDFKSVPGSWDFIGKSNRGGDPVKITVRATTDGMCASPSTNATSFSVAEQDLNGGVYYWQSTIAGTAGGIGGEIERFSFGDTSLMATTIAPPPSNGGNFSCEGCHFMSRDGTRMTLSGDDNDSDDEYGDVSMGNVDVANNAFLSMTSYGGGWVPGFQSFNPDHSLFVASNGDGSNNASKGGGGATAPSQNVFFLFNGSDGSPAMPPYAAIGSDTSVRPTMPDWSPDGKSVLYVTGQAVPSSPAAGWISMHPDDAHTFGGSIFSVPYMGNGMFGAPTPVAPSMNGESNYYPSYSPDGKFIVFNKVPLQGALGDCTVGPTTTKTTGACPNDSFSNPRARMWILPNGGGAAVDLELANGSPAASPQATSNSWPRWSPFIQTYKGNSLLWVTFSSTRNYGLHVRNDTMVGGQNQVQCYPTDTPETNPTGNIGNNNNHGATFDPNCKSPNIWMAAINLTKAGELGNTGGDPSYPAFWLPYQAIVDGMGHPTHNHAAQWTQTVVTMPPPDMGACIPGGGNCTTAPNSCCADAPVCTAMGICGIL
jgi:hypothetical protein